MLKLVIISFATKNTHIERVGWAAAPVVLLHKNEAAGEESPSRIGHGGG